MSLQNPCQQTEHIPAAPTAFGSPWAYLLCRSSTTGECILHPSTTHFTEALALGTLCFLSFTPLHRHPWGCNEQEPSPSSIPKALLKSAPSLLWLSSACHPQTLLTGSCSCCLQPRQPHPPGTSRHPAGGQPLPDAGSHLKPVMTGLGHFMAPCGYWPGSRTPCPSACLVTCVQGHGGCACSVLSGSLGLAQVRGFFADQRFYSGLSMAVGPCVSFVNNISQKYS